MELARRDQLQSADPQQPQVRSDVAVEAVAAHREPLRRLVERQDP